MDEVRLFEIRNTKLARTIEEVDRSKVTKPIVADKKLGRNDLCPCGSGKKFKHCHGKT